MRPIFDISETAFADTIVFGGIAKVGKEMASDRVEWIGWPVLVHSARTAVAAVASLLAARLFRLPEAYWAPITTLVITQSSLGAAFSVSWQRFVGTVLGAVVGAIVASHFGPDVLVDCVVGAANR